jgi:hypothetical protein
LQACFFPVELREYVQILGVEVSCWVGVDISDSHKLQSGHRHFSEILSDLTPHTVFGIIISQEATVRETIEDMNVELMLRKI